MGVLESRTGQTLSPNRIWRIEMSLKPVMQRHGLADLDALVAALVTSTSRQLLDDTVDAMLNNETFLYREHSVEPGPLGLELGQHGAPAGDRKRTHLNSSP